MVGRPPELYLELHQLNKLKDLSGLESLEQIGKVEGPGGNIHYNINLISLKGLENLRRGTLIVNDNEKLTDISALHNFQEGRLSINRNRSLSSCAIEALREALKDRPVILSAHDNAPASPALSSLTKTPQTREAQRRARSPLGFATSRDLPKIRPAK
jgi:hypothetical protein